jgi:GH24 family phage-related lysozyme (muramidase)
MEELKNKRAALKLTQDTLLQSEAMDRQIQRLAKEVDNLRIPFDEGARTMPLRRRKAEKTLITEDAGQWDDAFTAWGKLYKAAKFNPSQANPELVKDLDNWLEVRGATNISDNTAQLKSLREILIKHGYDTVAYENVAEGSGGFSEIILKPENIRSTFAMFDPKNAKMPDILKSLAGLAVVGTAATGSEEVVAEEAKLPAFLAEKHPDFKRVDTGRIDPVKEQAMQRAIDDAMTEQDVQAMIDEAQEEATQKQIAQDTTILPFEEGESTQIPTVAERLIEETVSGEFEPEDVTERTPIENKDVHKVALHGKKAIEAVRQREGELTLEMERVIEEEGYVPVPYKDSKGITTFGVGQTGEFIKKGFKESFKEHRDRAAKRIVEFDSLPEKVRAELIQAEYRGDLGQSPTAVRLFNEKRYEEAAKEFLNHKEYKTTKMAGIKRRMEAVAAAIQSLSK